MITSAQLPAKPEEPSRLFYLFFSCAHRLDKSVGVIKSECKAMENLGEDGFESWEQFGGWSVCSSEHWDKDHRDSSGFGDWTSFKEGLSEDTEDTADLLAQKRPTSDQEHKVEDDNQPWIVIHDCFHVEEMVRDAGMMDVLPLSHLLHNSTHTPPPPALLLRKGASFYHRLMCEPKHPSSTGIKPNLYSQKQLTDTLQLKQTNLYLQLQNPDLPQHGFEKPESSSAAIIQTKLTSSTWCQNLPGFFYQISHQWLSLRLQNHQDKKDLL